MMDRRTFLAALAGGAAAHAAGSGLIWTVTMANKVLIIDEAQGKTVGEIPLQNPGIPRNLLPSADRKKIYVASQLKSGIEVVDRATRKVTNHFVLDGSNRHVRMGNFAPDPEDRVLYTDIRAVTKLIDRYAFEKPKLAMIDLAQQKIVKTAELATYDVRRPTGRVGAYRVSPDGTYLYFFAETVRVFDTADLKLVDTIELEKPLYPGMENLSLTPWDDPNEDRNVVTGVFNSNDPIMHHSTFGIAKFDLNNRTFDFTPVGPAATNGMLALRLSPDGKTGYTVAFQGERGNRRCEFWVFDMANRSIVKMVEFDGPINFVFTLSGNGSEIYVHGASPFVEIYDAATLKRRKVFDANANITGGLVVMPRS